MPKMKTNKALVKRLKVTGRGKLLCRRAGSGHLKSAKSPKQLRRFRKDAAVSKGYARTARAMLGIGNKG